MTSSSTKHNVDPRDIERGYSPDAVWTRTVAGLGVGLLLLAVLIMFGISIAFRTLLPEAQLQDAGKEWRMQHHAPGVEPNQAYSRQRILADENASLRQYAWSDEEHKFAQIPIERAIEIMADRKLQVQWPELSRMVLAAGDESQEEGPVASAVPLKEQTKEKREETP